MRLYRNLAEAAVGLLDSIFAGQVADRALERAFKANPKWGSRDRAWMASAVYDTVRWRRWYAAAGGSDDTWTLLGVWVLSQGGELPAWEPWEGLDSESISARLSAEDGPLEIRESVPDWLDQLGEKELGDRWEQEITALNQPAEVVLRVNTLKTSREELLARLGDEGVEAEPVEEQDDAIRVSQRKALMRLASFVDGWFEVHDAASQLVAPFLRVEAGSSVVDACAGAGGKTLHIAALMEDTGKILAMDVDGRKLEELEKRADRAGVSIVGTSLISEKALGQFAGWADRLLLDVPCSGLGTLRRQPDLKWRMTADSLAKVQGLQRKILGSYPSMLEPGGLMVYATCSILPSENEEQVRWFLEENPGFELLEEKRVWPSEGGADGFYMALLKKR